MTAQGDSAVLDSPISEQSTPEHSSKGPPEGPPEEPVKEMSSGLTWLLLLIPILLLGGVLAWIVSTDGGLAQLAGPPVEHLTITRVSLPAHNMIEIEVVNDSAETVTIAQVAVDDAYWQFSAEPSATLSRYGRATIAIPYMWEAGAAHVVKLLTGLGTPFEVEIPAAVLTPQPGWQLFLRFGLVGLYVGVVPIALGMLWYPLLRKLGRRGLNFVLSLTIGLLVYLAIGTWLDALEFAAELPVFWQGVPLVALVALVTFAVISSVGNRSGGTRTPLQVAWLIALGIGLHNLGEGLAIGAAYRLGAAALGTFLVVGFTLHNITEGVGIVAPLVKQRPPFLQFVLLALLAGAPALIGVWIGGFLSSPLLGAVFLAIGVGAILQVIWEVGALILRDARRHNESALNWFNLAGVLAGIAIMYLTAILVKF